MARRRSSSSASRLSEASARSRRMSMFDDGNSTYDDGEEGNFEQEEREITPEDITGFQIEEILKKVDRELKQALENHVEKPTSQTPEIAEMPTNEIGMLGYSRTKTFTDSRLVAFFQGHNVDGEGLRTKEIQTLVIQRIGKNWLEKLQKYQDGKPYHNFLAYHLFTGSDSFKLASLFLKSVGKADGLPEEFVLSKKFALDAIEKVNKNYGSSNWPIEFFKSEYGKFLARIRSIEKFSLVKLNHFRVMRPVGKGAFGTVCPCVNRYTGEFLAIKVINKKVMQHRCKSAKSAYTMIRHESQLLALLGDKSSLCCLSLNYSFQNADNFYFVTKFCKGGDLDLRISYVENKETGEAERKNNPLPKSEVQMYAAEIACAIRHCHKMKIVHRDIKPLNVLLTGDGHTVLSDFGLSRIIKKAQKGRYGTPGYMAPEMLRGETHVLSCDWFSYGIMIYALLSGQHPFHAGNTGVSATTEESSKESEYTMQGGLKEIATKYAKSEFKLAYPEKYFDGESKEFIERCVCVQPEDRPKFAHLIKMDFLKDIDINKANKHELKVSYVPGVKVNAKSIMQLYNDEAADQKIKDTTFLDDKLKKVSHFSFIAKKNHRKKMCRVIDAKYGNPEEYNKLLSIAEASERDRSISFSDEASSRSCCIVQ